MVVGDPLWIESLDAAPLHKPLSPSSSTNRSFRLTQTYATAFNTQSLAGMSEGDGSSSAASPRVSARQLGAAMASTLALSRMTMTMGLPDTKDLGRYDHPPSCAVVGAEQDSRLTDGGAWQ